MASESEDQERSRLSSAAEEAQTKVREAEESAKSQAQDFAEQQKSTGADKVGDVAHSLHEAADDLHTDVPLASQYVEDVAGRLDAVASSLRERSIDEMVGNVADFARKQPAMFFAGAVATGFALSRFLKSSANKG